MDVSEKYQVLASGQVLEGYDQEDVKAAFSKKFNLKPDLAQEYFTGQPKIIKRDLEKAVAEKYKITLVSLGVDALLETMEEPKVSSAMDNLSLVPIGNEVSDEAKSKMMTCPKCGVEQAKAIGCESCGIIIEKYESAQLLLKKTVITSSSNQDSSFTNDTKADDPSTEESVESKKSFSLSLKKIKNRFFSL